MAAHFTTIIGAMNRRSFLNRLLAFTAHVNFQPQRESIDPQQFGARFDGATDDSAALQAAFDSASRRHLVVNLPAGTSVFNSPLHAHESIQIQGKGIGKTVLVVGSGMPLDSAAISIVPDEKLAQKDSPSFRINNLTIDGSRRKYPSYLTAPDTGARIINPQIDHRRNLNAERHGYTLILWRTNRPEIAETEFVGHQSITLVVSGCRDATVENCKFSRCGKIDATSPAILATDAGFIRIVTSVDARTPGLITLDSAASQAFRHGDNIIVRGGKGGLPDGTYRISRMLDDRLLLENCHSDGRQFAFDGHTICATANWAPSVRPKIRNNTFADLSRAAIQLSSSRGGEVAHNHIERCGEAGVYLLRSCDARVEGNTISDITLTDIVASGIEVNFSSNCRLVKNKIFRTDTNNLNLYAAFDIKVVENDLTDSYRTHDIRYPYAPFSERSAEGVAMGGPKGNSVAGETLPEWRRVPVIIQSGETFPTKVNLQSNIVGITGDKPPSDTAIFVQQGPQAAPLAVNISGNDFSAYRSSHKDKLVMVKSRAENHPIVDVENNTQ